MENTDKSNGRRKDQPEKGKGITTVNITNNFNAPVGQHIDHVDNIYFSMDKDGTFHFGKEEEPGTQTPPSPQRMVEAVEKCRQEGLWYAGSAWAVVFRVYEKGGYKGSISDFVRDAMSWPWRKYPQPQIADDAVSKPLRDGRMVADIADWEKEKVPQRNCKLAERLLGILGLN